MGYSLLFRNRLISSSSNNFRNPKVYLSTLQTTLVSNPILITMYSTIYNLPSLGYITSQSLVYITLPIIISRSFTYHYERSFFHQLIGLLFRINLKKFKSLPDHNLKIIRPVYQFRKVINFPSSRNYNIFYQL